MRKPEDVNPKKFKVKKIIYQDQSFSISVGEWQDDGSERGAMRWNGNPNDPEDVGYPRVFKNPMWFQLPQNFKEISLQSLLNN